MSFVILHKEATKHRRNGQALVAGPQRGSSPYQPLHKQSAIVRAAGRRHKENFFCQKEPRLKKRSTR